MFVRLSAAIAAVSLVSGAALAQAAKPTDPQIAHIAYTAGVIDIATAKQAESKASNKEVKAFAQDMVRDHEAVNKQALDLVKKLKVTPEDNDTSRKLSKDAADKRAELGKLSGAAYDKAYVANEVAYHKAVNGALEIDPHSEREQRGTEEPAADRPENLPGPPATCRAAREQLEIGSRTMRPRWTLATGAALTLAASVSAHAATVQITMENLVISPAEASAKIGDTIEWINKDVLAHTATARNGDFDVNLPSKKTGTVILKKAGAVEYYCRYHPNMKATLTVTP